jgi:hypothetical protein
MNDDYELNIWIAWEWTIICDDWPSFDVVVDYAIHSLIPFVFALLKFVGHVHVGLLQK